VAKALIASIELKRLEIIDQKMSQIINQSGQPSTNQKILECINNYSNANSLELLKQVWGMTQAAHSKLQQE
jgi:hypothetical protein